MANVDTILRDHVTLQLDCIDRLYLFGYVPRLQRPENLWWFFHQHRQMPILSPVLLKTMSDSFVARIEGFAKRHDVPVVRFHPGQRKDEVAREYLKDFKRNEGVVLIGIAQEKVNGFRLKLKGGRRQRRPSRRAPMYSAFRGSVHVNQYYFYVLDPDFGLGFIKFSSYAPFNIRVWLNAHEWVKRQADREGIGYEALQNGFFSCQDPERLQEIANCFDETAILRFFRRWMRRLPNPFNREDQRMGFTYELSIRQLEISVTQVFDRPVRGREFFEEVIRDNLDLGRPDRVQLLFERRVTKKTPGSFRTRIITKGVTPSIRFQYKSCRVKQYFKCDRALRTETVINDTYDFKVGRLLHNLEHLRRISHNINHRLLTLERTAHHCAVASKTVEHVVLPTVDDEQRAPALRWGDPRTMALFSALCVFMASPEGFSNRTLRSRVAALYDPGPAGYTSSRMSYDLRRLRLKRLIQRVPGTHRYMLTEKGRRIAFFMTKSYVRIVRPTLNRLEPSLPHSADCALRAAWTRCERALGNVIREARMAA